MKNKAKRGFSTTGFFFLLLSFVAFAVVGSMLNTAIAIREPVLDDFTRLVIVSSPFVLLVGLSVGAIFLFTVDA